MIIFRDLFIQYLRDKEFQLGKQTEKFLRNTVFRGVNCVSFLGVVRLNTMLKTVEIPGNFGISSNGSSLLIFKMINTFLISI